MVRLETWRQAMNRHFMERETFYQPAKALSEERLRELAPSIFATSAHDSRSDRFAPIPTIEIVRGLAREGFSVVGARQARAKDDSRRDYTKHLLRIRETDRQLKVG